MDATSLADSAEETTEGSEKKERPESKWKVTALTLGVLSLIAIAVIGARPAYRAIFGYRGKHLAGAAQEEMREEKWDSAARTVMDALKIAPDTPEVLRTAAELLRKTNGDPEMTRFFLQKLHDQNQSTLEDTVQLGQAMIMTGDTPRARRLYNDLTTAERQGRKGLELLAKILDDEGQKTAAMATLRQALVSQPDDPECRLRLAMLDLDQPFNETRRRAQDTIWTIAQGKDDTALQAIVFLSLSKELSPGEAERLLKAIEEHPNKADRNRLAVLSAYLRLFPTRRDAVLDRECAKYKDKSVEDSAPFYRWLNDQGQPQRILSLVARSLVLKSADAFPPYADAMLSTGKHSELRAIITGSPPPPLSKANAHLYLALCFAKLEPNLLQARQHVESSYLAATKSGEHGVVLRCAELAEIKGMWDLAAKGYEIIGQKNGRLQVPMLTKVYEMALLAKNGNNMLDAARRIAKARPDGWIYQARLNYLQLVLGDGFEGACNVVTEMNPAANAATRTPEASSYLAVLRALAFYRLGDINRIGEELKNVTAPDTLPPGLRAVMAGLLKVSRQDAAAFRLAEAVPETILLPEEVRFLKLAL